MNLSQGDYVAINIIFIGLVVGSYLFIRKGSKPPTVLNLQNPNSKPEGTANTPQVRNFSRTEYRPRPKPAVTGKEGPEVMKNGAVAGADEKDLNVLFNWNGHTWDAYEVLELPAGSGRVAVQKAFESKRARVDAESVPFVTAAYNAIIQRI